MTSRAVLAGVYEVYEQTSARGGYHAEGEPLFESRVALVDDENAELLAPTGDCGRDAGSESVNGMYCL